MTAKVIDLFCGIGGLTHGLQLAGLNVVAGVDIDSDCQYPYEKNNNAVFIEKDISELSPKLLDEYYTNCDIKILVGCAPCQPFSKYTHRYRKDGFPDDKWKLLYAFSSITQKLLPDIISMENVPELIHQEVYFDFEKKLIQLGYNVSAKVVYCPDYGVPQSRKRLVLLASKLGSIELIPPTYTEENYKTVRQTIGDLTSLENGQQSNIDKLHFCAKLNDINLKRIRKSIPGGTWKDWDEDLQVNCHKKSTGKSYASIYGRMVWDKPSPTITTQFYGYGNGRFGHPEQDRALSFREGAMLQSFPKDYCFLPEDKIVTNRRQLGIHIGNAVPVELGRAIGISILNHIEGLYENEQ